MAVAESAAERDELLASADAMASGDPTSTIEKAYAGALGYRAFFGSPDAVATGLFDDFLYRTPEAEELMNAVNMTIGVMTPSLRTLRHTS